MLGSCGQPLFGSLCVTEPSCLQCPCPHKRPLTGAVSRQHRCEDAKHGLSRSLQLVFVQTRELDTVKMSFVLSSLLSPQLQLSQAVCSLVNHRCCSSGVLLGHKKRGKVSSGLPHFAPDVWINTVKRWHVNLQWKKTCCSFNGGAERCKQVNCSQADTVYQHLPFNCCPLYSLFTPRARATYVMFDHCLWKVILFFCPFGL